MYEVSIHRYSTAHIALLFVCQEVYEFTVRCYYNTKRKCPFVAGME